MIGRLKKVAVREMNEEEGGSGFTAWLQDNLDVLNEAAGVSLSGVREEVSPSAAEIVARGGSGSTAVIEHEPGESDDEGLGRPTRGGSPTTTSRTTSPTRDARTASARPGRC